jgi:hypothetical protein
MTISRWSLLLVQHRGGAKATANIDKEEERTDKAPMIMKGGKNYKNSP